MSISKIYRTREFSQITGVTPRALRHYGRLGLLKPERSSAGYRIYNDRHLETLEQIVALKFIGVPLKNIRTLLERDPTELPRALRSQRGVLEEKQRLLNVAIKAIREAELALQEGAPYLSVLKTIIQVIEMQNDSDWMMKYFTDAAKISVQKRKAEWTPESQALTEREWSDLFRDIQLALDEDPSGPSAQRLLKRWNKLAKELIGADPQVPQGVKALFADQSNWPPDFAQKMKPFTDQRVWHFIRNTAAARQQ